MSRRGLLLLLAGVGSLVAPVSAGAGQAAPTAVRSAGEERAVALLSRAARAARDRAWNGTQYVAAWHAGGTTSTVVQVRHTPGAGLDVTVPATAAAFHDDTSAALQSEVLDASALDLLAEHYVLEVAGDDGCAGRRAQVVEALRPGVDGPAAVAGRFWLDRDSGLVLRREVYDETGRAVRSTAFVQVQVARAAFVQDVPEPTSTAALAVPVVDGWTPPATVGRELGLHQADVRDYGGTPVLHLAWSDGLSRVAVFSQPGTLGDAVLEGHRLEQVDGSDVWVREGAPEQRVWSGDGRVWTLLADAPPEAVAAAVAALPHDAPSSDGVVERVGRGLSRVGSWVNPFS